MDVPQTRNMRHESSAQVIRKIEIHVDAMQSQRREHPAAPRNMSVVGLSLRKRMREWESYIVRNASSPTTSNAEYFISRHRGIIRIAPQVTCRPQQRHTQIKNFIVNSRPSLDSTRPPPESQQIHFLHKKQPVLHCPCLMQHEAACVARRSVTRHCGVTEFCSLRVRPRWGEVLEPAS